MMLKMSPFSLRSVLAGFLLLLAISGFGLLANLAYFALTPANKGAEEQVHVFIPKGMAAKEVTQRLASKGVISHAKRFLWLGKITRQWKKMKAGEYRLSATLTPIEILSLITSGQSIQHSITIREGENIFEIAAELEANGLVEKQRFLTLCQDPKTIKSLGFQKPLPPSLEGYFFPDTYHLTRLMTAEEMIQIFVKHFFAVWGPSYEARASEIGLNRHEAVTLASIIEKETGAAGERAMISSVFHNRLRKRMRLQSDPTTIYGIWERFQGNLRKEDLLERTPYNTYAISGLPIGPIGNPGKAALDAALYPASSDYFFFVSHNDGTHEFTRNFADHQKAVRRYQLDPHAREGKSWRDLNSKSQKEAKTIK